MKVRRYLVGALAVAAACAGGLAARGSDDNTLRHDQGIVHYAVPPATPNALIGSVAVGDDVVATTSVDGLATLKLLDSSEIRIGDHTVVRIRDLRIAAEDHPAGGTIELSRGAVRFDIEHPKGAKANYRFVTPTAQVAVRGTVGYFVVGPAGDELYCKTCEAGDVTVTTPDGRSYGVLSGQSLDVHVRGGTVTGAEIVKNEAINNPAVDQFLHDVSPFGKPSVGGVDPTGSGSGVRYP